MQTALLTAIRTIVHADAHPVRQAYFSTLRESSRALRVVAWLYDRFGRGRASTLLVSAYGLKSWMALEPTRARCRIVAVAGHANARRQVEEFGALYGADQVDRLRTDLAACLHPASVVRAIRLVQHARTLRRLARLLHRIDGRRNLLISCRVAGLLGCYTRARTLVSARGPAGVLVSSASNPEEVGLVAAAHALGTPTIFVSHAYTTAVSPQLNFTLSILEGQAAIEAHARKGAVGGAVFLAGIAGPSRPMDAARLERAHPVIGICPPKVVAWPVLSQIIEDCRQRFGARQIIIRWHPSMIGERRLDRVVRDRSDIVDTPAAATLADVVAPCDWVVADAGSNVHLQVLKLGIPTIAVAGMGLHHADQYGFVAAKVVFPPVPTLGDLPRAEAMAFYRGEWATRFHRYDASYLRAPDELAAGLRAAVDAVLEAPRRRAVGVPA